MDESERCVVRALPPALRPGRTEKTAVRGCVPPAAALRDRRPASSSAQMTENGTNNSAHARMMTARIANGHSSAEKMASEMTVATATMIVFDLVIVG